MTFTTTALFAFNLLCGFFSCDPTLPSHESPPLNLENHLSYNLTIETRTGWLEGYITKTIRGRNIATFEGIPYAEFHSEAVHRFKV